MFVEPFINEKILQLNTYIKAVIDNTVHFTELDKLLWDILEEWSTLNVTDDTPFNSQERVFWHLIHELKLHGAQALLHDLTFKTEVKTCIDFLDGQGSYPIDCIGWRPMLSKS